MTSATADSTAVAASATATTNNGNGNDVISTGNDTEEYSSSDASTTTSSMADEALTTRALPYDADVSLFETALLEDLDLPISSISVDCCDAQGGRKWTIEFSSGAFMGVGSLPCHGLFYYYMSDKYSPQELTRG